MKKKKTTNESTKSTLKEIQLNIYNIVMILFCKKILTRVLEHGSPDNKHNG